ncbi:hypothetical protein REPUB_Repub20aG0087100 [Reevesia pubescens]
MDKQNLALLQKTAWRFLTEPNSLWVRVLKGKYGVSDDVITYAKTADHRNARWSYSWKSLVIALRKLADGLIWRVADGSSIYFWTDNWLGTPIVDQLPPGFHITNISAKVNEFLDSNGSWDSSSIFSQVPVDIALQIFGYPLPRVQNQKDRQIWRLTSNGSFTSKSAYVDLLPSYPNNFSKLGWIWHLPAPSRWLHFLWLVCRNRLPTNELRQRWGISSNASCPVCNASEETILHVLRDCDQARNTWKKLVPSLLWDSFFSGTLSVWLNYNLLEDGSKFGLELDWRCIFITAIWRIWSVRCQSTFQFLENFAFNDLLHQNILQTASELYLNCCSKSSSVHKSSLVGWSPTTEGFVKLNTDGAAQGNPGISGAGGLIRSHSGDWLVGFRAHLGYCSNIVAELQAVRLGLLLAWHEGFRHVICEIDARVVLDLIQNADVDLHPLGCLISDIQSLKKRNWSCSFSHVLREGNFSADALAKSGCSMDLDFEVLRDPPNFMVSLLQADKWGVQYPRGFKLS